MSELVAGNDQVAAISLEGVDTFKLADGVRAYHRQGARVISESWRAGTFVFADEQGGVDAVDESTATQKWAAKLVESGSVAPTIVIHDDLALVYGPPGKFVATCKMVIARS